MTQYTWKCAERVGMAADDEGIVNASDVAGALVEACWKAREAAPEDGAPYTMAVWIEQDGEVVADTTITIG